MFGHKKKRRKNRERGETDNEIFKLLSFFRVSVCCFRPLGKYLTSKPKVEIKSRQLHFQKSIVKKRKICCVCVAPMCVRALSLSIFSHFRDFSLRECRFDGQGYFVIWNIVLGHTKTWDFPRAWKSESRRRDIFCAPRKNSSDVIRSSRCQISNGTVCVNISRL